MKLNFCTLFNSNYLSRGLVMYESLLKHCDNFHLYIFAFDDKCYDFLKSQNYNHVTVVSLNEFENDELLRIKPSRSKSEYCWTCSSSTILYSINKFGLKHCTYIDADILFYSNPRVLVDEMGDKSVLITAHRYTSLYDQSLISGKYCVQFITFKNDERGMKALNWWKDSCIEWCYAKVEDEKFGDQKYLDEFEKRFEGIYKLKHLGGGLAPWNIQQYKFEIDNDKLIGIEIKTNQKFEPVFFHFHGLKFYENNIVCYASELYKLNKQVQNIFYKPYIKLLNSAMNKIFVTDKNINPHGITGLAAYKPLNLSVILRFYLEGIKQSRRNIFGFNLKKRIAHHYYFNNYEN